MPRIVAPTRPLGDQPELLTADEAAPYLRTSGRNARRLLADGHLDHLVRPDRHPAVHRPGAPHDVPQRQGGPPHALTG